MKSQGHEGFMLLRHYRKIGKEGETATFVSVMEPYSRDKSYVQSAKDILALLWKTAKSTIPMPP